MYGSPISGGNFYPPPVRAQKPVMYPPDFRGVQPPATDPQFINPPIYPPPAIAQKPVMSDYPPPATAMRPTTRSRSRSPARRNTPFNPMPLEMFDTMMRNNSGWNQGSGQQQYGAPAVSPTYGTDANLYGDIYGWNTAYQIQQLQDKWQYERERGQSGDDTLRQINKLAQDQRALEAQERMYGVGSETDRYRADRGMQGQLGAAQYGMQGVLGSADSRMRGTLGSAQYGMQGLLGSTQMQSDASRYASQQAADAQRAISRDRRFSDTLAARLGIVPSQMQQKRFERIIPLFASLINRFTPSSV